MDHDFISKIKVVKFKILFVKAVKKTDEVLKSGTLIPEVRSTCIFSSELTFCVCPQRSLPWGFGAKITNLLLHTRQTFLLLPSEATLSVLSFGKSELPARIFWHLPWVSYLSFYLTFSVWRYTAKLGFLAWRGNQTQGRQPWVFGILRASVSGGFWVASALEVLPHEMHKPKSALT